MAGETTNSFTYFQRPWQDYKNGFGEVGSDYWIGLDTLHNMTAIPNIVWRLEVSNKILYSSYRLIRVISSDECLLTINYFLGFLVRLG